VKSVVTIDCDMRCDMYTVHERTNVWLTVLSPLPDLHVLRETPYRSNFVAHSLTACYISRESYTTRNVLWSRTSVCLSVCLSAAACLHYCTDPDVTWRSGRECRLVVHYWADLQSVHVHGLHCYCNITRTVVTSLPSSVI